MSNASTTGGASWALLYDGRCPMCLSTVKWLDRCELLVHAEAVDGNLATDLPEPVRRTLRSVLVLYDRVGGETLHGIHGLIRLARLHGRFQWITRALEFPGLSGLAERSYRLVSLNRRVLSPPPNATTACDCDPPPRLGYRVALLVLLLAIGGGVAMLYGSTVGLLRPAAAATALGGALRLGTAAGAGWVANFLVFAFLLRRRFRVFVEQSIVVMTIGAVCLLPFIPLNLAALWLGRPEAATLAILVIAHVVHVIIMLLSALRRSRNLGFPSWVPWAWLVIPESVGVGLLVYFGIF